jgi:hypothetical protein
MVSRSIYNLKIDTIYMYHISFDRSFLQLSNGIRHVVPSTDPKPELTAKASMAQPVSQPAVYASGLTEYTNSIKTMRLNDLKEAHRNKLPRINCRKLEETLSSQEHGVTFSV